MNKIAISLIALAAISTAAFAERDNNGFNGSRSENYFELRAAQPQVEATNVNVFAVAKDTKKLTNFERVNKFLEENENGRN